MMRITCFLPIVVMGIVIVANPKDTSLDQTVYPVNVRKFKMPPYPPLARQAGVQGDVLVVLRLRADGTVGELLDRKGPPLLADHVVAAIKEWTFETGDRQHLLKMTFRFILEGPERDRYVQTHVSGSLPELIEIRTNPPEKPGPDVF